MGAALNGHLIRTESDDLLVVETAPHDNLLKVDMLLLNENIAYPASPEDEHHLPSPSFDPGDAPLSYHGHFVHKHSACLQGLV